MRDGDGSVVMFVLKDLVVPFFFPDATDNRKCCWAYFEQGSFSYVVCCESVMVTGEDGAMRW